MFHYVINAAHFACVHFSLLLPVTACDIWETYVTISDGAVMVSNNFFILCLSCGWCLLWSVDVNPGAVNVSHSKFVYKIDCPALDWPIANFPRYKYPVDKHVHENVREDQLSLAEVIKNVC